MEVPPQHHETAPTPKTTAHRVPIVPASDTHDPETNQSQRWNLVVFLVVFAALVAGGIWFMRRDTQPAAIESGTGSIADFGIDIMTPMSIMTDEEARIEVRVKNQSLFAKTVGIGVMDDSVFAASASRRIIDLAGKQEEIVSLPLTALSRGAWVVRVGVYDDRDHLIGTASKPLAVVDPDLRVRLDMGDASAINVPKNGRVYAMLRYEAIRPVSAVAIHLTSSPEKTLTFRHLAAGAKGSVKVWTTVPTPIRDTRVHAAAIGLAARSTWIDGAGTEHAVRTRPAADTVKISAFPRLFDQKGLRLSNGPLPLRADVPSTFWINLALSRDTRDAQSILVRAELAPGIEFTGRTWVNNGDKFSYDADARSLVWQTRPLRKTDPHEPLVGFEVRLIPALEMLGTLPTLLSSLRAHRLPDATPDRFEAETGPVIADFRFDPFAVAENTVRK